MNSVLKSKQEQRREREYREFRKCFNRNNDKEVLYR